MNPRILRNQEGASPGGGALPPTGGVPPPSNPPAPPAQGTSTTVDPALVEAIAAAVTGKVKDSVFAEARRSGMLGKQPKSNGTDGAAPAAAQGPDLSRLRQLDRAVAMSGRQLNEAAYNRIERAFTDEAPENAGDWLKDYFDGLGGSPAPAAPAGTTTTPAAPNGPPITGNRGTQPAPTVPLDERPILSMSAEDRAHYIKTKGPQAYRDKLNRETAGMSVKVR